MEYLYLVEPDKKDQKTFENYVLAYKKMNDDFQNFQYTFSFTNSSQIHQISVTIPWYIDNCKEVRQPFI